MSRLFFSVILCLAGLVGFTGCHSSKSSAARYRGDAIYGYDNKKGGKGHGKYSNKELQSRTERLSDPLAKALVAEAETWLGVPYLYGGQDKNGTDCSGMVMEVYRNVCGLKLPRSSREQSNWCQPVDPMLVQPGDLVFFAPNGSTVSHVGMYVGNGEMIHASLSKGVMFSSLSADYWRDRLYGVGRVAGAETAWRNNGRKLAASEPQYAMGGKKKAAKSSKKEKKGKAPAASGRTISVEEFARLAARNKNVASGSQLPDGTDDAAAILEEILDQKIDSIFVNLPEE